MKRRIPKGSYASEDILAMPLEDRMAISRFRLGRTKSRKGGQRRLNRMERAQVTRELRRESDRTSPNDA